MTIQGNGVQASIAVLSIFLMCVALGAAWLAGRRRAEALFAAAGRDGGDAVEGPEAEATTSNATDGGWSPDPAIVDRVVRVVALLFIAAAGVVVAITGDDLASGTPEGWARYAAIYLLLAAGTLFIVFMQDLLPSRLRRETRYWLEAAGALLFLTLLVGLTGGLLSPFFAGFFLLVGGASLAGEGRAPIALAVVAAVCYATVGLWVADGQLTLTSFAWIAFNVAAMLLLAYAGTIAGGELRRARDAALRLSRFDPLTGLHNRTAFFAAMDREIRRVERSGRSFGVVMLDIDDLKPVNDTFGHPAGDQLLRAITDIVKRTVRATDTAARYGGDEFVVLLPETDAEGAYVVAEKLRRDVSALVLRVQDRSIRTSVSLGLVAYPGDGETIEALIASADAAMYEAKRRGKNQIVGYATRTERVATAIPPEPGPMARQPMARPRQARPVGSRAAEVGRSRRPEASGPVDPSDPVDFIGWPPAAPRSPEPPRRRGSDAAPRGPAPVDQDPPTRPGAPIQGADLPAGPAPDPDVPAPRGPVADLPHARSAVPPAPVRVATLDPTGAGRTVIPIWPSDPAASGRVPVPPAGAAPWQIGGPAPWIDPMAPRMPRTPDGREYAVLPVGPDEAGA